MGDKVRNVGDISENFLGVAPRANDNASAIFTRHRRARVAGLFALRRLTAAHPSASALPSLRDCFAGATIPNANRPMSNFF